MTGGSIAFHLEKSNRFKENHVKFYSSQIISAIVYLHLNHLIILYKFKFENLCATKLYTLVKYGFYTKNVCN